jgi:hypothetical protein
MKENNLSMEKAMKPVKSERLKKLEIEMHDLEEWLRLGLVPKKDMAKHTEEIRLLKTKIAEEKERLQFMKEGGEAEEFVIPKRAPMKGAYNEMPTIPDVEAHETGTGLTEGFDATSYATEESSYEEDSEEYFTSSGEEKVEQPEAAAGEDDDDDEDEESYFSEKSRWRRGGIIDPDADQW